MKSVFDDVLKRRNAVHERILNALKYHDRETAMNIILCWMSIEDLEEAAKTICKDT